MIAVLPVGIVIHSRVAHTLLARYVIVDVSGHSSLDQGLCQLGNGLINTSGWREELLHFHNLSDLDGSGNFSCISALSRQFLKWSISAFGSSVMFTMAPCLRIIMSSTLCAAPESLTGCCAYVGSHQTLSVAVLGCGNPCCCPPCSFRSWCCRLP